MSMTRLIEEGIEKVEQELHSLEVEERALRTVRSTSLTPEEQARVLAELRPAITAADAPGTAPGSAAGGKTSSDAANALQKMVEYIPTEIVTLYIAACAAYASLSEVGISRTALYWGFVAATPAVFILILLGKRRSAGKPAIPPRGERPWFRFCAATIAFAVWALAVPDPAGQQAVPGPLAALGALLVSTALSLCEPVFGLKKKAANA